MTEKVKDQSFGESLESKGTADEVSNLGNSKIKYTRALLLGLEVCCKLPADFDVLILREINEESDGTIEKKIISGHYSLPRTTWTLTLPGERWENRLWIRDKESHLQGTCSLEGRNVACQQSPEDSYRAGVLGRTPPKSDLPQLSKSENPYRPPHCNKKKLQPSENSSESGKESSLGSDQRTSSADSDTPLVGVDYSTSKPLGDCEDSTEENEVFVANETIKEIIEEILEDNQLTFDDYWAETLETLHLFQQKSCISATANTPDSELEIRFRSLNNPEDEDSLISIHETIAPKKSTPTVNAEGEIKLPDEDSLISIHHLFSPESLKARRNTTLNTRNKAQRPLMQPQKFGPEKTSHINFRPPMMMMPNMAPCYMTSYSVLHQPNILPHLKVDASSCHHQFRPLPSQQLQATSTYRGFGSSNAAGGFGNEGASRGFSLWHAQF